MLNQAASVITATPVPWSSKFDLLPSFFGIEYMLYGENGVYNWMGRLSPDYRGGSWDFYELSNGGFYMSLRSTDPMRVIVAGNGFSEVMSANAASIVANLFLLCQMAEQFSADWFSERYHALREYTCQHLEASKILGAID